MIYENVFLVTFLKFQFTFQLVGLCLLYISIFSQKGIGEKGLECLEEAGIKTVWQLVGKFLMLDCNKKAFTIFLEDAGIKGNNRVKPEDIAELVAYKVDLIMKN